MNPQLAKIIDDRDETRFTLNSINVSLANAIRRTILSDIPTTTFYTETYNDNQCTIHVNTTRLHNEILKHRLSCIPICEKDTTVLPGKYILELDVSNDTENMIIVTTKDFRIRNKETGAYATEAEVHKIFPPFAQTGTFIDFCRLRPRIGDSIPGEQIKLTCEFSVHCAKDNSMFNVVSKCAYGNTPDIPKIDQIWEEQEGKLASEGLTKEEIEFQKRNFYILDSQRHFIENSFDFVIQTIGQYENREIVKKACSILQNKFVDLIQAIDSDQVPITNSETTMDNCFDITLENEDYTIGKVIEYVLYEKYYLGEKIFSYCGFKKFHPHSPDSTIRLAYAESGDKRMAQQHLRIACLEARDVFKKVEDMF
uniref:DNA-directed RNA polymerase RpoA/D/Rpb3-type domain-containing protein n=1 Tax=viral metagenome TaxID=1070528 RepID=A0A6C0D3V5_9ZZZZ